MSNSRTYLVGKILKESTNIKSKITVNDIRSRLLDEGINVTRNTIKSDINDLISVGYKITEEKGRHNNSYYYIENDFSIEECRVILNAVNCNKFIKKDVKNSINNKILSNVSFLDRVSLRNTTRIETLDTGGIDIMKNISYIEEAISSKRIISFIQVTRDVNKKIITKKLVEQFIPKNTYYFNDRHYVIGINKNENIRFYRIDRMSQINLTIEHNNSTILDLNNFGNKNFDMFGSDKVELIELKTHKSLIDSMIERFGDYADIHKCFEDENYFILKFKSGINTGLIRWILKQGSKVKVVYPQSLITKIREEIEKISELYN